MAKRNKIRRHCGNCNSCGSKFTGPDGALYEHRVCETRNVGAIHNTNIPWRCVCDHVSGHSRPKGCPGWERRSTS
jgi:hypothetical protein